MRADIVSEAVRKAPPLYSQENTDDPVMFARLYSPGNKWMCYVAEANKTQEHILVYGLFIGDGSRWGQMDLFDLEKMLGEKGASLSFDKEFAPVRLSELTGDRRKRGCAG